MLIASGMSVCPGLLSGQSQKNLSAFANLDTHTRLRPHFISMSTYVNWKPWVHTSPVHSNPIFLSLPWESEPGFHYPYTFIIWSIPLRTTYLPLPLLPVPCPGSGSYCPCWASPQLSLLRLWAALENIPIAVDIPPYSDPLHGCRT